MTRCSEICATMTEYGEIADPPRQAVIETVTACALKCPACYIGNGMVTRKKQIMSWELFSKISDQIEPFVKHVYLHLWGEPLSNPRLPDMILRVKQFATVDVSTHGQLVTEANADALCQADTLAVSMEGLDQETYQKYRVGGSFDKAMGALKLLAQKRAAMGKRINWTWVVTKDNLHQLEDGKKLAESMGNVNLSGKPPYFTDEATRKALEPDDPKYQRYHPDGTLKADRFACKEFWSTLYLNPEGIAGVCCYDFNFRWPVGDFKQNTILDIWNGPEMRAMRRKHLSGQLNELCATQCGLPE